MEETKKAKKKIQVFPIVNAIIMILLVIITLYPVLNTLAISLNDGTDALRGGIYLWPRKFTWKNYITVLQKDNLLTGAYITVSRTIIGTVLALVSNAILAFIISRKRFLFKRGLSQRFIQEYEASNPDVFKPYQLVYKAKKQSPATPRQKRYLQDLIKYHRIDSNVETDALTKSEASRLIDKILSSYGRIME